MIKPNQNIFDFALGTGKSIKEVLKEYDFSLDTSFLPVGGQTKDTSNYANAFTQLEVSDCPDNCWLCNGTWRANGVWLADCVWNTV